MSATKHRRIALTPTYDPFVFYTFRTSKGWYVKKKGERGGDVYQELCAGLEDDGDELVVADKGRKPLYVIKKSTIDKAGLGLFAAKQFAAGDVVGTYRGEMHVNKSNIKGAYGMCVTFPLGNESKYYIDGVNDPLGKMNNSQDKAGNNVVAASKYGPKLIANKDIHKGDEMFLDYGGEYWEKDIKKGDGNLDLRY